MKTANPIISAPQNMPSVNHQSVGNITGSTVAGINVCGSGITIVSPEAENRLFEIIEGHNRLVEQQQTLMLRLMELLMKIDKVV